MSALVKLLLFSLTILSVFLLAASPMAALNPQSGIVATVSLGSAPMRPELLEVGGASMMRSWFENGREGVRIPEVALFSGPFAGPVSSTLTILSNGTQRYPGPDGLLNAVGVLPLNGTKVQMGSNTDGVTAVASGYSYIGSVPEPSMLVMVGTGLLAVLTKVRQKFS